MTLDLPHHDTYRMTERITTGAIDDLRNKAEEFFSDLFAPEENFKFWRTWPVSKIKHEIYTSTEGLIMSSDRFSQKWACEISNHIQENVMCDEQDLREYCIEHDLPYASHIDSLKAYAVHSLGAMWNAPVETNWEFHEKEHPLAADRKVLVVHAVISDASI